MIQHSAIASVTDQHEDSFSSGDFSFFRGENSIPDPGVNEHVGEAISLYAQLLQEQGPSTADLLFPKCNESSCRPTGSLPRSASTDEITGSHRRLRKSSSCHDISLSSDNDTMEDEHNPPSPNELCSSRQEDQYIEEPLTIEVVGLEMLLLCSPSTNAPRCDNDDSSAETFLTFDSIRYNKRRMLLSS